MTAFADETWENGVFAAVYDAVNHLLNTTDVSPASGNHRFDEENFVFGDVYDPVTKTLRVVSV